jgi:hypothetical protein
MRRFPMEGFVAVNLALLGIMFIHLTRWLFLAEKRLVQFLVLVKTKHG